ncbi:MAG: FixH family protein [Lysobacteraceae bacterium]
MTRDIHARSPWRQPMVWLLVAIPLLAVVATAALVVVAGGPGATDDIAEPVKRTAQVQVADLGPDAHARALGLSALVRSDKGVVEVLPVAGDFDRHAPLTVALRHPTLAAMDRVLVLEPNDTGWRTRAQVDPGHDWNVQVDGAHQGAWRLQGRWPAKQAAVYVAPAVGR